MENVFKASIENLPMPVLCIDKAGIIKFNNSISSEVFNTNDLAEKNLRDVIPFPETKKIDEIISDNQQFSVLIPIGETLYDFLIKGNSKLKLAHMYGFDSMCRWLWLRSSSSRMMCS